MMGRLFLKIYVGLNIVILALNLVVNILGKETIQILTNEDWLIFIIACGALAISEVLEETHLSAINHKNRFKD